MSIIEPQDPRYQAIVNELMALRQRLSSIEGALRFLESVGLVEAATNDDQLFAYDMLVELVDKGTIISRQEWENTTERIQHREQNSALLSLRKQMTDIKSAWCDFQVVLDDDIFNYEDDDRYVYVRLASLIEDDKDMTRDEYDAAVSAEDDDPDDFDDETSDPSPAYTPADLVSAEATLAGYQALRAQCTSELDVRMTESEMAKARARVNEIRRALGMGDADLS